VRRAIRAATAAQREVHDAARALGCMVCRYRLAHGLQSPDAGQCGPTQLHHVNLDDLHGQPQLGQDDVVALGAWHHDGDQLPGHSRDRMRATYGPSFKHHARDFRAWTADVLPGYGRGTAAWKQLQDELLARTPRTLAWR
jgi:hypothetical protein